MSGMGAEPAGRRRGRFHPPGLLYDLAFGSVLKGVRRRIAAVVEEAGLWPWLDVCCGTGGQFREAGLRAAGAPGRFPAEPRAHGLDNDCRVIRYAAARAPGAVFVCGDAAFLPFKDGIFRSVSVSFGLHDKGPEDRRAMMAEARRVLASAGRLIAADFEKPWSPKSRRGAFLVHLVERAAGGDHYRNGRDFLRRGGLRAFLPAHGFVETIRNEIESASISVVVARPDGGKDLS